MLVDDRERDPIFKPGSRLTFPWGDHRGNSREFAVTVEQQRLDAGDYAWKGYEPFTLGEKKGSIGEVRQNLFAKRQERTRFFNAVQRMCKKTKHPILILTFPPDDEFHPGVPFTQTEDEVWCRLMTWVHRHNLTLLWWDGNKSVSYRRAIGTRLMQLMWTFAWEELLKGESRGRGYEIPTIPGHSADRAGVTSGATSPAAL